MRRIGLLCLPFTLLACADPVSESLTAPVTIMAARDGGVPQNFQTHLAGDNEVPARETLAQGNAKFQLAPDGESIEYKLIASNINNAFMAHIHCGVAGTNGPIVVWLFPSTAPVPGPTGTGRHDGILAEGTFTSANIIARASSDACPGGVSSLADLLAKIQANGTYVNVHTRDLDLAATALQAGNFPGGEVRGQIDHGSGM